MLHSQFAAQSESLEEGMRFLDNAKRLIRSSGSWPIDDQDRFGTCGSDAITMAQSEIRKSDNHETRVHYRHRIGENLAEMLTTAEEHGDSAFADRLHQASGLQLHLQPTTVAEYVGDKRLHEPMSAFNDLFSALLVDTKCLNDEDRRAVFHLIQSAIQCYDPQKKMGYIVRAQRHAVGSPRIRSQIPLMCGIQYNIGFRPGYWKSDGQHVCDMGNEFLDAATTAARRRHSQRMEESIVQ